MDTADSGNSLPVSPVRANTFFLNCPYMDSVPGAVWAGVSEILNSPITGPARTVTAPIRFKPCCSTGTDCDDGFQGGHQEICIRPGLWMSTINFFSDTPVCLEYEKQSPVIDFGFAISGGVKKQTVCSSGCSPKQIRVKSGSSSVRMENRQTGMFTIPGAAKQRILHLHMTLPFFRSLVKPGDTVLPLEMQAILKGASQAEFVDIRPMTPDIQTGFRQAYGKSVFDYFREYRMQRAMQLLDEIRTNVSQTAWPVGYTNVSHFSEAFGKRFGILPKQYLKNRLQ